MRQCCSGSGGGAATAGAIATAGIEEELVIAGAGTGVAIDGIGAAASCEGGGGCKTAVPAPGVGGTAASGASVVPAQPNAQSEPAITTTRQPGCGAERGRAARRTAIGCARISHLVRIDSLFGMLALEGQALASLETDGVARRTPPVRSNAWAALLHRFDMESI
jgi:hypothetical protein